MIVPSGPHGPLLSLLTTGLILEKLCSAPLKPELDLNLTLDFGSKRKEKKERREEEGKRQP